MTLPKAILICSLLTSFLTKSLSVHVMVGGCPAELGEWNDWYNSVAYGLVNSRRSTEVQWGPRTFRGKNWISASLENGRRLADLRLPETLIRVRDLEAIALSRENGTSFIYLADIGYKWFEDSPSQIIYKFKEPRVSHSWQGHNIPIRYRDIERIFMKFPDPLQDFEAMAVDPLNGDILLFTKNKRHEYGGSKVYKMSQGSGDSKTLEYVTTMPMLVTEADISPTGDILIMTYDNEWDAGYTMQKPDGQMAWADFLKDKLKLCRLIPKRESIEDVLRGCRGSSTECYRGVSRRGSRGNSRGGSRDSSRCGSTRSPSSRGPSRSRS